MIIALLVGLACGFVGSIPIAGPSSVLVVERALGGHTRAAVGLSVGTGVAEAAYALLAFLGMTAALSQFRWLMPASRLLGAVILLGLGLYFALGPTRQASASDDPSTRQRGRDGLWLGLVVTAVNPTLIVTWSAVVTVLHSAGILRVQPLDAFPFAVGVGCGVTGWFAILVAVIARLHHRISSRTMDRVVRVLGWILVLAGVGLIVKLAIGGLYPRAP